MTALYLGGPTATGKSAVAMALAEALGGEIISVDSMQVYRGLDVGTAKPSIQDRRRVPHHLIDIIDLNEFFDAAQFCRRALEAEAAIGKRGRIAIFCGGSGLYFKAYQDGLGPAPAPDPVIRRELEGRPLAELLAELDERDPDSGRRIDRRNRRRIIRALEVARLSGRRGAETQAKWNKQAGSQRGWFALAREAPNLRARIDKRVAEMFAAGLVKETQRLLSQGLLENRTAQQAIGYRQVIEHLDGQRSVEETIQLVKQRTWQLARRQRTWFRRQLPVQWIGVGAGETPAETARRMIQALGLFVALGILLCSR